MGKTQIGSQGAEKHGKSSWKKGKGGTGGVLETSKKLQKGVAWLEGTKKEGKKRETKKKVEKQWIREGAVGRKVV